MSQLADALRQAAIDLTKSGRAWALVGGFAVSARALPRFTRDVDMAVAVDDDTQAEILVRSLLTEGYLLFGTVEHDNGRLATARLRRPFDGINIIVDLLFASSGIEAEIVAAAELIEILPDLRLPVATTGHLIALKLLARDDDTRPQDLADLRALHTVATPHDLAVARAAIQMIMVRGYGRNRDLLSSFTDLAGSG